MTDRTLRLLRDSDVVPVAALLEGTFSGWSEATIERELKNAAARYVVLEEDGVIVGFAGLWLMVGEGHVVNVIVAPERRGQGFSRLLVHALVIIAGSLEIQVLTLEVRVSNATARSLYRSYGFYEVGDRPDYYADGEDALIMTTELIASPHFVSRLGRLRIALEERFKGVLGRFEAAWEAALTPGDGAAL